MKKIVFFLLASLALIGCKNSGNSVLNDTKVKPSAAGRVGEMIAVISDELWESSVGDSVFYTFTEPFPGLPQDEPTFKIVHIPPSGFEKLYKINRNLLIVKIKQGIKPDISVEKDKWANNQIVMTVEAPDTNVFLKLWAKNKRKILRTFFDEEIARYQESFEIARNKDLIKEVEAQFGISMIFPEGYKTIDKKSGFLWISRETAISTQAVFITTMPYKGGNQLSVDSILMFWSRTLRKNVPGPKEGTYPGIEWGYVPTVENITVDGKNAVFIRGLWRTEGGYFLGGPFLCLTVPDMENDRVVTVFSLIYGGKKNKKLYVWQVEAILKTLKITLHKNT